MSHPEQRSFVATLKEALPEYFRRKRVLEFGSLDLNGSIRVFFEDCDYTGVDIGPGPGVDVVAQAAMFECEAGAYDTVASCEMLEHDRSWESSFARMLFACGDDGLVFFSCASLGRHPHGVELAAPGASPLTVQQEWRHYRNLVETDFTGRFRLDDVFARWKFFENLSSCDLYFVGLRSETIYRRDRFDAMCSSIEGALRRDNRRLRALVKRWYVLRRGERAYQRLRYLGKGYPAGFDDYLRDA